MARVILVSHENKECIEGAPPAIHHLGVDPIGFIKVYTPYSSIIAHFFHIFIFFIDVLIVI